MKILGQSGLDCMGLEEYLRRQIVRLPPTTFAGPLFDLNVGIPEDK